MLSSLFHKDNIKLVSTNLKIKKILHSLIIKRYYYWFFKSNHFRSFAMIRWICRDYIYIYMVCILPIDKSWDSWPTEKSGVILTLKVESLAEVKFDPGFRVIGEHMSQIDSQYRVNF